MSDLSPGCIGSLLIDMNIALKVPVSYGVTQSFDSSS